MPHVRSLIEAALDAAGDAWIGDHCLRRVRELAAIHPIVRGGMALEVHLGPAADRVDLVTRVLRCDGLAIVAATAPELDAARRFATRWLSEQWGTRVPYVDLEFDLDAEARGCFVGAMLEPRLHDGAAAVLLERPEWIEGGNAPIAVALAALGAAETEAIDDRALDAVRHCFDALPEGAFIGHLGSLRTRLGDHGDLVRLIASLPRRHAVNYLRALEWPGRVTVLSEALDRYLGGAVRVDVDLNVTPHGLLAESGFYSTVWSLPQRSASVGRTTEVLLADGLVTAAQATALHRFAEAEPSGVPTPRTLTTKLKIDAAGRLSAKVYLSFLGGG